MRDSAEANHRDLQNLSTKGHRARQQFYSGGHETLSFERNEAEEESVNSQRSDHGQHCRTAPSADNGQAASGAGGLRLRPDLPSHVTSEQPYQVPSFSSSSSSFFLSGSKIESLLKSLDSTCQPGALREHPYLAYSDQLQRSARCEEDNCDDPGCKQLKNLLLEVMKSWMLSSKPLTGIHDNLLICMYDHCLACDSRPCVHPWCVSQLRAHIRHSASGAEKISIMRSWLTQSVTQVDIGQVASPEHLVRFDCRIKFDSVPKEGSTWDSLCLMGQFSKARLVKPNAQYKTERGEYWVLKRSYNQTNLNAWGVYIRLLQLKNIQWFTPLLWAAKVEDATFDYIVCSALEGTSLCEHVQSCGFLAPDLVVRLMLEVTVVLACLRSLNIVYLNWTCKNVLVYEDSSGKTCIKLINFEASIIAGRKLDIQSLLPVHLLPPEVLDGQTVEVTSDLWGVACLLFELTTHRPVWHEHRHSSVCELLEIMKNEKHPRPPDTYYSLKPLFDACWKVDPKERVNVAGLQKLLEQHR